MTDRRALLSNGKVAHSALRGQVVADRFTDGTLMQVAEPVAALLDTPNGTREREALLGDRMLVLESADGFAFGALQRDGYVGYVVETDLAADHPEATHRVSVPRTYAKATPELKTFEPVLNLSFGAAVAVTEEIGEWTGIALRDGVRYLPTAHLDRIGEVASDPVSVARLFLGTPYLWGGNSAFGLDCSGLVQAACLACGIACPGDSDQQRTQLGAELASGAAPEVGDLLFWRGHVAFVASPTTILHANAHHMRVVEEPMDAALARIAASDTGPVTSHRRL